MKTSTLRGIFVSLSLSLRSALSLSLSLPLTGVMTVAVFLRAAALSDIRD